QTPAFPCVHASTDSDMMSSASTSMSNRAPKALAMPERRASHPSAPSINVTTIAAAAAPAAIPGSRGSPLHAATRATSAARPEALPSATAGDVIVRALYSGISRGTEALVFQGRVPPTEFSRMRAPFQSGEFPAPVKYGYASVGEIERGPRDLEGRRAFVLFPHQTRYVVPADAVHVLPPSVPAPRAVLAANLETAINGVWDAAVKPGDRVVVIGGGTVGCLCAWL